MFGVREIKNHSFKYLSVFKSITDSLIKPLNLEELFKILKIFHEKIKQILCIIPFSEQQSQLINLFIWRFYSPKVIIAWDNPYKPHNCITLIQWQSYAFASKNATYRFIFLLRRQFSALGLKICLRPGAQKSSK